MCLVEGVAGSCELVHDHIAEVAEVVEPFAEDVVDIDAICFPKSVRGHNQLKTAFTPCLYAKVKDSFGGMWNRVAAELDVRTRDWRLASMTFTSC